MSFCIGRRRFLRPAVAAMIVAAVAAGPRAAAEPLRVAAASSLADALKAINKAFTQEVGSEVLLSAGASNLLARQIAAGAPADVFVSADAAQMDALDRKQLIVPGTRQDILSNALVVIVPTDSELEVRGPRDLVNERVRRLSTGHPEAVPVGVYAKAYFQKLGLWERLAPKVVATDNVRAALAAVESGNMDAGIVYRTDALMSKKVRVAWEVPPGDGPKVAYPMAMIQGSGQPSVARRYLEFLKSPAARKVFESHGFIVLAAAEGKQ
ncbi:MAG: molybdate ABC transporter substrate-binding protein [Verrucomicrobiales bacterium]